MLPQILSKENFGKFVAFLMEDNRVVAPMSKGHQYAFKLVEGIADIENIRMDYDITILPPKKYLLPTYEKLLEFSGLDPSTATSPIKPQQTVILGAHPYDIHALSTTDAAMRKEPADSYYVSRANVTKVIGVNIQSYVNDQQFMADMKTTEPPAGFYDLFLTDLGDRYFVEVGRPAGNEMITACGLMKPADREDFKVRQEYDAIKNKNLTKRLPYDVRYLPELLDASYDSLLWDAIARRCFSCGTCTNVCPTCYCFDVLDKLNIDATSGTRQRMWDSCQLRVFAEVAGGENFREQRSSRLRHRMFRKGKYINERTGRPGCVGCGRCSKHCVAKISILEAFQQIADRNE